MTRGAGCVNSLLNHVSDGCFILGETGSDGSGMYLVGIEDHNGNVRLETSVNHVEVVDFKVPKYRCLDRIVFFQSRHTMVRLRCQGCSQPTTERCGTEIPGIPTWLGWPVGDVDVGNTWSRWHLHLACAYIQHTLW